jgi:dipeptidyl aminopeptidase/acylaminoacyl peptidase
MSQSIHRLHVRRCFCPAALLLVFFCRFSLSATADEAGSAFEKLANQPSALFGAKMVRPKGAGHDAFVLIPPEPKTGGKKPWVWYAPTLLAEREEQWVSPGERHAWIFRELLASGIYVAGVDVGESYGSLKGRRAYDRFYAQLVDQYAFSPKPGLLAISRGGMMAYNWAADRPDRVRCIGGIYPLCNLAAYPRLERIAAAYDLSVEALRSQIDEHNPIARLRPLAVAQVPILHLHGDRDEVVPLDTHSAEFTRRYRALGGEAEVIVIPGKGHEIAKEYWQEPRLIQFFRRQLLGEPLDP